MGLAVTVQHHPSRAGLLPALLDELGAATAAIKVVSDPDPAGPPNPWRTYRAALERAPAGSEHLLIVQDDAVLSRNFIAAVELARAARPDTVLALFVAGIPISAANIVRVAAARGLTWARLAGFTWLPTVALVWPRRLIEPALAFVDAQGWPPSFRSDDEIVGRAVRGLGERCLACAPSLVEHPDVVPSLIGRPALAGRNAARVAACWIGRECDPLTMDWDSGATA